MKKNFNVTALYCIGIIITATILPGCKKNAYIYLNHENNNKTYQQNTNNIEVTLVLSKNSLVDNLLTIKNNTKDVIMVSADNIVLRIPGTALTSHAVKQYNKYLSNRKTSASKMCSSSSFPYACVDQMNGFYGTLKNKGFSFGAIAPGTKSEGLLAFNVPLTITGQKFGKEITSIDNENTLLIKGIINLTILSPKKNSTYSFPVGIQIYDDIKKVPYAISEYFQ